MKNYATTRSFLAAAAAIVLILALTPLAAQAALTKDANGVYQISSYADLKEFAALVNGGETTANARVSQDINRPVH